MLGHGALGEFALGEVDLGTTPVTPPATGTVGEGGPAHGFSRKKFHRLLEELEAEARAAEQKADALSENKSRARKQLEKAAEAAKAVASAWEIAADAATQYQISSLIGMMEAANSASNATSIVNKATAALQYARELYEQMEDEEDEDMIALLFS